MPHATDHSSAIPLDCRARIPFERMAEGIIGHDEEPGLAARGDERRCGSRGQRIGVERPLEAGRRAVLAGEIGRACQRKQHDLVPRARHALHRECDRGDRHIHDRVYSVLVEPARGDGDADIRLALMVRDADFHAPPEHGAGILGRHSRGDDRALLGLLEAEHADLDGAGRLLRPRTSYRGRCDEQGQHDKTHSVPLISVSWPRTATLPLPIRWRRGPDC